MLLSKFLFRNTDKSDKASTGFCDQLAITSLAYLAVKRVSERAVSPARGGAAAYVEQRLQHTGGQLTPLHYSF